jgi:Rhodopirellula transposase DDE domain
VHAVNAAADADPAVLRVSLAAKATVKRGPFSRGGTSRVAVQAADHDFHPAGRVTPVGSFLPEWDELCIYQGIAKVTSDCLVARLCQWWDAAQDRFAHSSMRVLNLDNGPEHHSQRTPCLSRLVQFVARYGISVRLAY